MTKTIEEIEAEETQIQQDIAELKAAGTTADVADLSTEQVAVLETADIADQIADQIAALSTADATALSTSQVADLTPEQQTGAAPLTEDAPIAVPANETGVNAPNYPHPMDQVAPVAETETAPAPGSPPPAVDQSAPVESANEEAPETAEEAVPEIFAADFVLLKSEVKKLASKIYGEAMSIEESGKSFILSVGTEVKHIFHF